MSNFPFASSDQERMERERSRFIQHVLPTQKPQEGAQPLQQNNPQHGLGAGQFPTLHMLQQTYGSSRYDGARQSPVGDILSLGTGDNRKSSTPGVNNWQPGLPDPWNGVTFSGPPGSQSLSRHSQAPADHVMFRPAPNQSPNISSTLFEQRILSPPTMLQKGGTHGGFNQDSSSPAPQHSVGGPATLPTHRNLLLEMLQRPKPAQGTENPTLAVTGPVNQSRDTSISNPSSLGYSQTPISFELPSHQPASAYSSQGESHKHRPCYSPNVPSPNVTNTNPFTDAACLDPREKTRNLDVTTANSEESSLPTMPAHTSTDPSSVPPLGLIDSKNDALPCGLSHSVGSENPGTVANVLSEIAPQIDRQVQEALNNLEDNQVESSSSSAPFTLEAFKAPPVSLNAGPDIGGDEIMDEARLSGSRQEDASHQSLLACTTGAPPATLLASSPPLQKPVDAQSTAVAESWEAAAAADADAADPEDALADDKERNHVVVYSFPMRPFLGLKVTGEHDGRCPRFRADAVQEITRLRKEFDQTDRNLVTASAWHIVYGMSRNGGIRVIRQEDGHDAKLFTDTHDRIFHVMISSSAPEAFIVKQAIIGTGVSGTVYWNLSKNGDQDCIEGPHPEQYGFALPPVNGPEGDTSGGVLKTRVRASSFHPEYFAVGRGKSIHIIWPSLITAGAFFKSPHDRTVDIDKFISSHSLKINTGKAGKDFSFSVDDTTIVTLDKAGKVSFWDIRRLVAPQSDRSMLPQNTHVELTTPMLSLNTTADGDKPWPTSVLLVDKPRAYQKRSAQRYLIVGTKQNHSFQLWDLVLRKVVQEVSLPHNKDCDAACSLMFHSETNMIIVGHPTRNSVYFMHLSAPKYSLRMSQVEYVSRLASAESMPAPDSTAVLSGFREVSFTGAGSLRSLDLLSYPTAAADSHDPVVFELYAMHSKGVACIHVCQRDLGWSRESRIIHTKDALECQAATTYKVPSPSQAAGTTGATMASTAEPSSSPVAIGYTRQEPLEIPGPNMATTSKIRGIVDISKVPNRESSPALFSHDRTDNKQEKAKGKRKKTALASEDKQTSQTPRLANSSMKPLPGTSSITGNDQLAQAFAAVVKEDFCGPLVNLELRVEKLIGTITDSFEKRDVQFESKSRQMLDGVSGEIIAGVQRLFVDANAELDRRIAVIIKGHIEHAFSGLREGSNSLPNLVKREVASSVPEAVDSALQTPALATVVAQSVKSVVVDEMQQCIQSAISSKLLPRLESYTAQALEVARAEYEKKLAMTTERFSLMVSNESAKIDHLIGMVSGLQETVKTLTAAPSKPSAPPQLQQESIPAGVKAHESNKPTTSTQQLLPKTDANGDLGHALMTINDLLLNQQYEAACLHWIQGEFQQEIFDVYFVNLNTNFLAQMPLLIQLSITAIVSDKMKLELKNKQRTVWLDILLQNIYRQLGSNVDSQTKAVIPNFMDVVVGRAESAAKNYTGPALDNYTSELLTRIISTGHAISRYFDTNTPLLSSPRYHHQGASQQQHQQGGQQQQQQPQKQQQQQPQQPQQPQPQPPPQQQQQQQQQQLQHQQQQQQTQYQQYQTQQPQQSRQVQRVQSRYNSQPSNMAFSAYGSSGAGSSWM